MTEAARLPSSFRDPSGFVFEADGSVWRQINATYQPSWQLLESSGLLSDLTGDGSLIQVEAAPLSRAAADGAIAVVKPERVPFISYPYEWCFSQLQDAALLTLAIQKRALARGMSLKDASSYNVQFLRGKPIFIDTLSFEAYVEGQPWIAYRQFCSHFLAPLALMALVDVRLGSLLRNFLDGVPLDLTSELLPGLTKLRPGLAAHIHLHAKAQRADGREAAPSGKSAHISKTGMLALIDSLDGTIRSLNWEPSATEWANYYGETNYTDEAMAEKHRLVGEFLDSAKPCGKVCWDLGSNTGEFAQLAAARGYYTLAIDGDPAAVEKAYRQVRSANEGMILPLLGDLSNPSPRIGWSSEERESLMDRGPADIVLGLALVHHLAIGNNVPLASLARFFSKVSEWCIVEFVPKSDSQVIRLLRSREDIFADYDQAGFEAAMAIEFEIVRSEVIAGSKRMLYLLKKRR